MEMDKVDHFPSLLSPSIDKGPIVHIVLFFPCQNVTFYRPCFLIPF